MISRKKVFKKAVFFTIGIFFCLTAIYLIRVRMIYFDSTSVDLQQDFYAARRLINHESIYSDPIYVNNHPPITALILAPLSFLPYPTAGVIWTISSVFLYLLSGCIVIKELNIHLPIEYLLIVIGFSLSWHPFLIHIGLGQWSIFLGFCLIIFWLTLRHNRDYISGIFLGIACLIKLFPALFFVYLILTKRFKALWTAIAVSIGGTLLLGFVLGPKDVIYYFTTVVNRVTIPQSTNPTNISITGFLGRFFSNGYGNWIDPIFVSPIPIYWLSIIIDIVVLFILIRITLRLPNTKFINDIVFSLFIISMLFISPVTWQHYLTLITIPIWVIFSNITKGNFKIKYGYLLSLLVLLLLSLPDLQIDTLLLSITFPNRLPWYAGIGFLYYDVGLLILCWLLLQLSKNTQKNGQITPPVDFSPIPS